MTRIIPLLVAILVASLLAPRPVMSSDAVIELLRLEVPATQRQVWLAAEQRTQRIDGPEALCHAGSFVALRR